MFRSSRHAKDESRALNLLRGFFFYLEVLLSVSWSVFFLDTTCASLCVHWCHETHVLMSCMILHPVAEHSS